MHKVEEEAAFEWPLTSQRNSTVEFKLSCYFLSTGGHIHLMRNWTLFFLLTVVSLSIQANAAEPRSLPPLADGQVPACPEHPGTRILRNEVVSSHSSTVSILAPSIRNSKGCEFHVKLDIANAGTESIVLGNNSKFEFYVIDFAPDGSSLLLDKVSDGSSKEIAVLDLSGGQIQWHDVWNLFGWRHCDAMVEPQGFTADGRIVVLARPSIVHGHVQPDCVPEKGLYATDTTWRNMSRLPDSTTLRRYGERLHPAFQACKSDPDILGECFKVHGSLMFTNGTPGIRIWRTGTHRILGVHNQMLPENLAAEMNWDTEAYGDFTLCPFTPQRQGEMQMVCVESAQKVRFIHFNEK